MTNHDQSLIDGLTKRLKVEPAISKNFRHGQLRRAAYFAIKECGHEWALKVPVFMNRLNLDVLEEKLEILLNKLSPHKANQQMEFGVNLEHMQ